MEPLLAKKITIKKDRTLIPERIFEDFSGCHRVTCATAERQQKNTGNLIQERKK